MTVYFISGLGADERVFQRLQLLPQWQVRHLAWLTLLPKESLESYSKRMAQNIDTNEDFVMVGLSFGGIVAVEISKWIQPKRTIILSSIATRHELPVSFRLAEILKINRIVPAFLLNKVYPFTYWYFGVKKKEEKELLQQIIHDTPPQFLKWAINEILHWKNEEHPKNLVHIHGTKDHIFPVKKTMADIKIKDGGHLMVYSKADEISSVLIKIINGK